MSNIQMKIELTSDEASILAGIIAVMLHHVAESEKPLLYSIAHKMFEEDKKRVKEAGIFDPS